MSQIVKGQSGKPRAHARSNVFLAAVLEIDRKSFPVRLRNISRGGALLDGKSLPGEGGVACLRRGDLLVAGWVAWQASDQLGFHFAEEIDVDQWVKRAGHPGQQRVDGLVAAVQGQIAGMPGRDPQTPESVDSLVTIHADLAEVCNRLADSPGMCANASNELLRLDAIVHRLSQFIVRSRTSG